MNRTRKIIAAAILLCAALIVGCSPTPPKETVLRYGKTYSLVKRPEPRGAERWIFRQTVGTNDMVIMEAIIEDGTMVAAMQGSRFTSGWCGTGVKDHGYFQYGHSMYPILPTRIQSDGERATLGDNPIDEDRLWTKMRNGAQRLSDRPVHYRFRVPVSGRKVQDAFALFASNNFCRIVLLPESTSDGGAEDRIVPNLPAKSRKSDDSVVKPDGESII